MGVALNPQKKAISGSAQRGSASQACSRHTALVPTRWGVCGIAWSEYPANSNSPFLTEKPIALLSRIIIPGLPAPRLRARLLSLAPGATEALADQSGNFCSQVLPGWFAEFVQLIRGYFTNAMYPVSLEADYCHWTYWKPHLDLGQITPFQEKVYNVVAGIPRGQILSYAQVAQKAGNVKAARAVGAALGNNPWPILIPCHRVIGSSGSLTGFTAPGGVSTKRRMLKLEHS